MKIILKKFNRNKKNNLISELESGEFLTSKKELKHKLHHKKPKRKSNKNVIPKIETWSDIGRNLFYDEMNTFKNILNIKLKEKNLDANTDKFFDKLFKYVKSWFFNEEQIIKYINEDKIEFKYIKSIIENGKEFKDKNIEDKKKFLIKIEEMYYGLISDLNLKLSSIK